MKQYSGLLLIAIHIMTLPLQGCIPVFLAAAGGSGYFLAEEEIKRSARIQEQKISESAPPKLPQRGVAIDIKDIQISPTKVKKGSTVTVTTTYEISHDNIEPKLVEEETTLWNLEHQIAQLANEHVQRESGIWKLNIKFKVPSNTESGKYIIKQHIKHNATIAQTISYFIVN